MPRKKKVAQENDIICQAPTIPAQTKEKHHILKMLENAQVNEAFHNKYIKELQNQYSKIGHDSFLVMFINCLKQLIAKEDTHAYANVGLKFMAKFATSFDSEDMHPFSEAVLMWVLKTVSLVPNIRSRLCQFVNLLLNSLGSNASLDDSLFDEILKYMFDRLKDLYPTVRVQAIKALQRLQMPDDPDDAIVKIYTFHLSSDPSGVVRQAVLTCLGRNIHTIPVILERLWDVDEKVRRHVYVHMSNYPVKSYKVANRLTFLEQGLNDRSDSVRKIVTGVLIPQWLESYNKNYLAFLSGLKLDSNEVEIDRFRATARLALFEIFKTQKSVDLIKALSLNTVEESINPKCIRFDKLTVESSLFWWALIVYFQQDEQRSEYLEQIIPELTLFCSYVQTYNDNIISEEKEQWDILISQSILFSLIEILLTFDYGDEIGRQHLRTLVIHLLTTNPCNENIIKSLISICEKLIPNWDERLQVYVEVIRSLVDQDLLESTLNFSDPNVIESLERDPNLKVLVSSLKLKLYELKEGESKFVKLKYYAEVSRISEQITLCQEQLANIVRPLMTSGTNSLQQKRITKELQIKALQLAFHGVSSRIVTKLNPAMCQLYTDFIRLKIESSDMDVRNWALKCGATFSLMYEQLAKDVFSALNKQFFDHHITYVWTTSVGAMFQLIVRYGFSYFDEDTQNSEAIEDKQKEKSKKSRTLYNASEYLEDPEDETNIEKGNVTIKGLIYLFGHFMDTCDDIHLMSALIDGFGLLIIHGLYEDEKLVSRLILLYFNPTTEAEVNQILSIFFETLIHKKKQECLEAALIQTLTKIIEASSESPLHEVKIETVLKFIINSTLPVYCKSGVNIHNNMAVSLLKWMNDNATNRELLRITSKEILSLEISDDSQTRKTVVEYVERLLEMPMDSKTEKNLKNFVKLVQGNRPKDIEFSSVAPANRIDGELQDDDLCNDEQTLSDDESSNKNDEEKSDDECNNSDNHHKSSSNDNIGESDINDNGETFVNVISAETVVQKEPPESTGDIIDPIVEVAVLEKQNDTLTQGINQRNVRRRKRLSSVDGNDRLTPPFYTSETVTDNEPTVQQIKVVANIHNQPVILTESHTISTDKNKRRKIRHVFSQQQLNTPNIQTEGAPIPKNDTGTRLRRRPKKMVAQTSSSSSSKTTNTQEGKRKIDAVNNTQNEIDFVQEIPKSKKSRPDVFSETNQKLKLKIDKCEIKSVSNVEEKKVSIANARRKRPSDVTSAEHKNTNRKNPVYSNYRLNKNVQVCNAKKPAGANISTQLNKRVGHPNKSQNNQRTESAKRLSDPEQSLRPSLRGSRKLSQQNTSTKKEPLIAVTTTNRIIAISSRTIHKAPTGKSSHRNICMKKEPVAALATKKTHPSIQAVISLTRTTNPTKNSRFTNESASLRLKTTKPMRKINSKVVEKSKDNSNDIAVSASNIDKSSNINSPQHRTRHAIAKEFKVNNVMTRNRSSIDGIKLLEKLKSPKHNNSVAINEKSFLANKSTGLLPATRSRKTKA